MSEGKNSLPHVIVAGNPVDGFEFYGPFPDTVTAADAGNEDAHLDGDWWVAPVNPMQDDGGLVILECEGDRVSLDGLTQYVTDYCNEELERQRENRTSKHGAVHAETIRNAIEAYAGGAR